MLKLWARSSKVVLGIVEKRPEPMRSRVIDERRMISGFWRFRGIFCVMK